jgi:hypothetical protein
MPKQGKQQSILETSMLRRRDSGLDPTKQDHRGSGANDIAGHTVGTWMLPSLDGVSGIGARMSNPTKISRGLVAAFAADVEGYSRLMGADELNASKGLREAERAN